MTNPYHITPEQALKITTQCGMDIDLIDTTGELEARQVPEGFVLVPKEPTNSMVEAAEMDAGGLLSADDIVDAYRAMLAAAPSPDSGEVKP